MIEKRLLTLLGVLTLGFAAGFTVSLIEIEKPKLVIPTNFQCTHLDPNSRVNIRKIAREVSIYFKNESNTSTKSE